MRIIFKISYITAAFLLVLVGVSCKKGAFDINSPNPNTPSSVDPSFVLPAALVTSAQLAQGGNEVFLDTWMGYWAISGDYSPNANTLTYTINTDFFTNNWDVTYQLLENYKSIEISTDPHQAYFVAIAKIMAAYHYQRLVDLYNNIPYTEALNGGVNNYPKFDDASVVYPALVDSLGIAINLINGAPGDAVSPDKYDVMFGGHMDEWIKFANTLKLKILMRTAPAIDPSSQLSGLTGDDFLGNGEDATVNPGYSNSSAAQQSPFWNSMGYNTAGTGTTNSTYYRANSYAVNFYNQLNDPRITLFYDTIADGTVKGRAFGSTALEHNLDISSVGGSVGLNKAGIGKGLLKSPSMDAVLLPATESLFLQAEAIQRGYLDGDLETTYEDAIAASFSYLGVDDVGDAVDAYVTQSNTNANLANSTNKIKTIILQKWAAMNGVDPL